MAEKKIKLYADGLSQPCRAVWWFLALNKLPYEVQIVNVFRGEHLNDNFGQKNPHKVVPCVEDADGKLLNESHTIMRYLKEKHHLEDHWYPKDLDKRYEVDNYLDWHISNLRYGGAGSVSRRLVFPKLFGVTVSEDILRSFDMALKLALQRIDSYFLNERDWIAGAEISIADLSAYEETKSLEFLGYDFSAYPRVSAWRERMKKLPFYDEVHAIAEQFMKTNGKDLAQNVPSEIYVESWATHFPNIQLKGTSFAA